MLNKDRLSFDLGKIMDDIFGVAEDMAEKVQTEVEKNFPFGKHHLGEGLDYYPAYSFPPMNVYLTSDRTLVVEMALAGFKQEGLDLRFQGDFLIFSGKYQDSGESTEGLKFLKRRLKLRSVEDQKYFVPEDKFDRDRTQAVFKDGLLRIMVPWKVSGRPSEGIKVEIKSGEIKPEIKPEPKVKKEV